MVEILNLKSQKKKKKEQQLKHKGLCNTCLKEEGEGHQDEDMF